MKFVDAQHWVYSCSCNTINRQYIGSLRDISGDKFEGRITFDQKVYSIHVTQFKSADSWGKWPPNPAFPPSLLLFGDKKTEWALT